MMRWSTRITDILTPTPSAAPEDSTTIEDSVADDEKLLEDWRSSPSEIMEKLLDPSATREELFDAVLFAEIAAFDESQTDQLTARLFDFVSEHRLSKDEDVKTTVGAAIRKLAMNLQDSQIEKYADLFLPTETDTLPCEIELELAKAILWRLMATPASLSKDFPKLEGCLGDLALDYLTPRLILQENYASVALQAALGVLLLNGQHANRVLQSIKDLQIDWFADLFQRQVGILQRQLMEIGDTTSATVASNLEKFELELQGTAD